MNVKVYRYDPSIGKEAYYQVFKIPVKDEDNWTIMDVLNYISLNLDNTLAYYRHSACNHGICGRCSLKVNGLVRLACIYPARGEEILLEPKNAKVIKDLVTQAKL